MPGKAVTRKAAAEAKKIENFLTTLEIGGILIWRA